MIRRLLFALVLIGFPVVCPRRAAADQDYEVTTWRAEDGLPADTVTAIAQTPDGYLWVGTIAGLARFDGARFAAAHGAEGLAGESIRRLFTDRTGALWIATGKSRLFRCAHGRFSRVAAPGLGSVLVTSFAEDRDGSVWLSTDTGGVFRCQREQFERLLPDASTTPIPTQLAADVRGDGTLWLRRGTTVGFFEGATWKEITRDGPSPARLGPLSPKRGGGVWLFAAENRLDVLGGGRWPLESRPYPPFMDPSSLLEDAGGRLWIGTYQQGLVCTAAGDSATRFFTGTGFPIDGVNCLFEDREGNVWVGGTSAGLARLTRWNFVTPPVEIGLPPTAPLCLSEDTDGAIWAGFAESGLWRIDGGRVTGPMTDAGAEVRRSGWALHVGRDGRKWYGAYGVGLFAVGDREADVWTEKKGLPSNDIRALCEGPDGALWIGSVLGLARFDGTRFVTVPRGDGPPRKEVNALVMDRQGGLWIGGKDGLAVRPHEGAEQVFRVPDGLPSDDVRALLAGQDGSIWIGTTRGLAWWRDGKLFSFDARNGLPGAEVYSIVDDQLGHLWLGTHRGVRRVALAELGAVAEGALPRLATVRTFGREDGLPSLVMTRGQPGALRTRDGRLWFATLKGLAIVNPRDIRSNPVRPAVLFEEVLIDSAAVPFTGRDSPRSQEPPLRVPAGVRRLEIRYTAPILTAPERVRFQRRLDGIDDDWRDAGGERSAVYHGLRPGHYRLRLRAANNDGVWGDEGAGLAFFVAPVWWETVWFRVAGAMGFAGVLGGAFWLRLRVLDRRRVAQQEFSRLLMAQQEAERQRIAAELHDSLGQSLSIIQNRAVLAANSGDAGAKSASHLAGISDSATAALAEVREICQGLRPVELDRLGLTKTLHSVVERLAGSSGLKMVPEIDPVDALVAPENWIHVLRFVQEALSNVIKHAGASEVTVTVREDDDCLRLVIADNGSGFDTAAAARDNAPPASVDGDTPASHRGPGGLGLTTMRERARILGAEMRIESAPGRGMTLRLAIPVAAPCQSGASPL